MAAGHLRSQIRYHCVNKAVSLDDKSLVLRTRDSNALDFALLIQELVPLLEAYERACSRDDGRTRLELADAICQGISPDPELFLNRVELLGAYSMIEPLFIATDLDGRAAYTPMGRRHVRLLDEYEARIARVAASLHDDYPRFRPVVGAYSPYGVLYGFSADLVKHMVLKATQADAVSHFGLEDVFAAGDADALAWVTGWRKLPHLTREMEKQFDYPQRFADDIFNRIEQALQRRVSGGDARTGRFVIVEGRIPDLPSRYTRSLDDQFLSDRREGKFVVSYETQPGGWLAITKTILTEVLGEGRDVTIGGLPPVAAGALRLAVRHLS
jgi:hypothetical protein